LSGKGTVHSWIVSRHPSEPTADPRIVAVVALAEDDLRIVTNLVDVDPDTVAHGAPVVVCFRDHDGTVLPQFRPADGPSAGGAG
jgi:uncharacterized OB-fold protein